MKPRIFVGSSSENLKFAKAVQENLEQEAEVTVWTQDVFGLSAPTLDSLAEQLNGVDFGVIVLGPDDTLLLRGKKYKSARDNVILELGMCIGRLGRARTFFILPRGIGNFHIPTDLLGLTSATFDPDREDKNPQRALGPACNKISRAMGKVCQSQKSAETDLNSKLEKVLYRTIGEIADATSIRNEDIGVHLWVVTNIEGKPDPVLVRKVRVRLSHVASSLSRYWSKGEGVVGQCWKFKSDVVLDLTDPKYQMTSEVNWNTLSSDVRMGLTYDDFRKTTRHFKAIFAVPIVSKEEFIGCISLNIERGSVVSFDSMHAEAVTKILQRSAVFSEMLLR